MKRKLLSMLLSVCMVAATVTVMAFAADSSYSDTDGHWAEAAINRWSDAGVVKGVTGDTFNPNGDMTRAQAAQVFANLLKLKEKADISQFKEPLMRGIRTLSLHAQRREFSVESVQMR